MTASTLLAPLLLALVQTGSGPEPRTTEHDFATHEGYPLHGRLTLPAGEGPHPVVVYVQTARGMTIDMLRPGPGGATFSYFDLYTRELPGRGVGFFRYEGRGIRGSDQPPSFETIERAIYDTSTLENKVRDLLGAVEVVRGLPGVDPSRILVMGDYEGTLLAAEAAARAPERIAGLVLYGTLSVNLRGVFRFQMTDGGFLAYQPFLDGNGDGKVSPEEYEADPSGFRAKVFGKAPFAALDRNGDGAFTPGDMPLLMKPYLIAADTQNYAMLDSWAKNHAGISTPANWFRDHFEHAEIWSFLSGLRMPVGLFHGERDASAPVAGVRELERRAHEAGRDNLEFHYFEGLDHTLDIMRYFRAGELPPGHAAILAFIERVAAPGR